MIDRISLSRRDCHSRDNEMSTARHFIGKICLELIVSATDEESQSPVAPESLAHESANLCFGEVKAGTAASG
jgi:hypothetical protein